MENSQERTLLDRSLCTARSSKQDANPTSSQCSNQFWSSMQPPTSDYNTQDGNEFAKEESNEHLETLKFVFPKKVKARGRRKANANKRRVTFADH
ncbi:hypothetical protein G5I_01266 [Acromyrmex echinatior]|uniref:Uncharacterized protein n=1 Tax=Acromyrmex echinatior TaxID=103372 RepID=F4W757_ACREC|nr:hypothetical protein G5I_01266 [Acromyrmex echinatior]